MRVSPLHEHFVPSLGHSCYKPGVYFDPVILLHTDFIFLDLPGLYHSTMTFLVWAFIMTSLDHGFEHHIQFPVTLIPLPEAAKVTFLKGRSYVPLPYLKVSNGSLIPTEAHTPLYGI